MCIYYYLLKVSVPSLLTKVVSHVCMIFICIKWDILLRLRLIADCIVCK